MTRAAPLIDQLALLIERTYDIDSQTVPLGRFVVGDEGHRRLTAGRTVRQKLQQGGGGARVLLRPLQDGPAWAAALYLPDELVAHLERRDPRRMLDDENVEAFATLVEEIDHLVTFAERARCGADVSLLELEWHAAVSKYLVLSHFVGRLTRRARLRDTDRAFVEHHVFHAGEFVEEDDDVRDRYRQATRLAWRFVRGLQPLEAPQRLALLRRFHRASHQEKLASFAKG